MWWWMAAALAGPWTRAPGDAYLKLSADGYATTRYVAPDALAREATYRGLQVGAYAEVGLVERLQVSVAAPLVVGASVTTVSTAIDSYDVRTTSVSPGDLWVAPQVALSRSRPLALRLEAKVPMYGLDAVGRRDPVYRVLYAAPGDGQIDLVPFLTGGASAGTAFGEAELGYAFRTPWAFDDRPLPAGDGPAARLKGGIADAGWLAWVGTDARFALAHVDTTRQWVTASVGGGRDLGEGFALEARVAYDVWTRAISQGIGAGLGLSWRARP